MLHIAYLVHNVPRLHIKDKPLTETPFKAMEMLGRLNYI